MAKKNLKPLMIEIYNETEEGKKYLEYNDKVGGEPIGLMVPDGYPKGVKERGGPVAVYNECIEKGVTWEELIGYSHEIDDNTVL